uniref:Predicted N-carbamyl-L-amino acid amidohydrolase n=1 Tax=uncultured alpha proteobacterium EBAC2C11 TaxID=295349 RepID=Q5UEZ3_9PROT|nr:predicted N-carbamyl-L-amino acid amidohydrolase [uncultured alpha proteobacterium EBAC2C11]
MMNKPITAMLNDIASCSESARGVTRLPFSQEHRFAVNKITRWMKDTGLSVHMDASGTLIGRLEGPDNSPTLLFGSHQDSVRHGGKYDGIMGVLLPILALQKIGQQTLPFSVQVMAFADEEGVRFPTALIGPRALAGNFDNSVLNFKDHDGVSVRNAMIGFGLNPDEITSLDIRNTPIIGYVETHIEQGPILDDKNLPLGIVTAIAGIERHQIELKGLSGHAGTTPMYARQDAFACAAELVLIAERVANDTSDLIATIGKINVSPNAVNVIPGEASMVLEIRSAVDKTRIENSKIIIDEMRDAASKRSIDFTCNRTYVQAAVPCDKRLRSVLKKAASIQKLDPICLTSGATHDASAMSDLCPMAMLFVRCHKGISHTPEEYARETDMQAAVDCLVEFMNMLRQ